MSASRKRKHGHETPDAIGKARLGNSVQPKDVDAARKVNNACTECRKQKIKCAILEDGTPCVRCLRRGLSCMPHTPFRNSGLDQRRFDLLVRDTSNLHKTLTSICHRFDVNPPPPMSASDIVPTKDERIEGECEVSPSASPSNIHAPMDTYLMIAKDASPHRDSPQQRQPRSEQVDLVNKGLLTVGQADALVVCYLTTLDSFLYGLCGRFGGLQDVRNASPVLLAGMCTVAALHGPMHRDLFDRCNGEYRHLVSTSLFEKRSVEHIRALCIGSFWLPDASRILSSDAIRRAADCRLSRHFHRLLRSPSTADALEDLTVTRDRVRLWYLLFVCDQHLSVLHNRDCLMRHELDIVTRRTGFLPETGASNHDIRVVSQVALLVIVGQIRDALGGEQTAPVSKTLSVQFSHFARELDEWFAYYSPMFQPDAHIGGFPLAGLTCHYQFARLYLGHHFFRGLNSSPIPTHFHTAAAAALEAAANIFNIILNDEDFRSHIVGMPHYFHIMISFAGQFLLEVCSKYRDQLNIDAEGELRRVNAVLALFARTETFAQHPIARMTMGLVRKLSKCAAELGIDSLMTQSPFTAIDGQFAAAQHQMARQRAATESPAPNVDFGMFPDTVDDFDFSFLGDLTFPDTFDWS